MRDVVNQIAAATQRLNEKRGAISQLIAGAEHSPVWHDVAELGGLGLLAAPSVSALAGHPWEEKNKTLAEIGGLGVLAAPSAHNLIGRIRRPKTAADERVQGPYLRYDNEVSNKAIGQPPEEQQSPAFSRPEPPSYGGYRTDPVSLPRYQFEVSEQPTLGTAKALPSAKESVASVVEKIAQYVDEMNQEAVPYYTQQPQYIVLPPQEKPSGSFVPPLIGAAVGAPLGWRIGEEVGLAKYPGYKTLDKAVDWLRDQSSKLPNEPLIRDAADVAGGTLWGKYQGLKMLGPIGAHRLGGAALGLGGGLLAGSLVNKAMEEAQ